MGNAFEKFHSFMPVKKIKENKFVLAFDHPNPNYKIHILLVPKRKIKNLSMLQSKELIYVENIFKLAKEIIKDMSLEDKNYRIITNGGNNQKIKQLHFHLISD